MKKRMQAVMSLAAMAGLMSPDARANIPALATEGSLVAGPITVTQFSGVGTNGVGGFIIKGNNNGPGGSGGPTITDIYWGNATGGPGALLAQETDRTIGGVFYQQRDLGFPSMANDGTIAYSQTLRANSVAPTLSSIYTEASGTATLRALERTTIASGPLAGNFYGHGTANTPLVSAQIAATGGDYYFLGTYAATSGGAQLGNVIFKNSTAVILKSGDSVSGNTIANESSSISNFGLSRSGTRYGAVVDVVPGSSPIDSLVVTGTTGGTPTATATLFREGSLIIGGDGTETWGSFSRVKVNDSGSCIVSGFNSASGFNAIAARDGAVIFKVNQSLPVATGGFLALPAGINFETEQNSAGDYAMEVASGSAGISSLIVNGKIVVTSGSAGAGIPATMVDLDGNGTDETPITNVNAGLGMSIGERDGSGNVTVYFFGKTAGTSASVTDILLKTTVSAAVNSGWRTDANAYFTAATNWDNGGPHSSGDTATFGSTITAARTVTVDAPHTVSTLNFDNANKYTLAGTSILTIDAAANAAINVTSGSHDISAPVKIAQNTTVSVSNSADKITLSNLQTTNRSITKTGAGSLEVNALHADGLSINGGTVKISTVGTAPISTANELNSLSIGAASQLDITNNALVIHSSDTTSASRDARWAQIVSGQNNFDNNGQVTWDGPGIISSTARASNIGLGVDTYVIGVVSNHDLASIAADGGAAIPYDSGNPWLGTVSNIGADDILVRMTYAGDTNLDGTVTIDDYNNIDGTFSGLLPNNYGWVSGDFDFNGVITIDDYNAIDTGYLYQGGQLTQAMIAARTAMFGASYVAHLESVASAFAVVPEPSTIGLLASAAAGLLLRRRHRNSV